jgi:hypothetical protein
MKLDARRIEVMDEAMAEISRKQTVAEPLAVGFGLWRYARRRHEGAVRTDHPDWDDRAVKAEVNRRMRFGTG